MTPDHDVAQYLYMHVYATDDWYRTVQTSIAVIMAAICIYLPPT